MSSNTKLSIHEQEENKMHDFFQSFYKPIKYDFYDMFRKNNKPLSQPIIAKHYLQKTVKLYELEDDERGYILTQMFYDLFEQKKFVKERDNQTIPDCYLNFEIKVINGSVLFIHSKTNKIVITTKIYNNKFSEALENIFTSRPLDYSLILTSETW